MFQKYVRQNTQEFFFTFLYVYYVQCNEVISYQLLMMASISKFSWSTNIEPYNEGEIGQLEMVRCRGLSGFVRNRQRNTSSVGDMLQHLNWHSLEAVGAEMLDMLC